LKSNIFLIAVIDSLSVFQIDTIMISVAWGSPIVPKEPQYIMDGMYKLKQNQHIHYTENYTETIPASALPRLPLPALHGYTSM